MDFQDQKLLISHLNKGDEEAFAHIVEQYGQRLFTYALTLTNNQVTSQDIVQNVFLRTWEHRKKIDVRHSLRNYLFKSVRNEFINQYKKKRATRLLEQKYFEALEKVITVQDHNIPKKKIDMVIKEIHNLPPKCREVFILSRKEGLTNVEISSHLNISIKTVEAHITNAFSILRKKLGNNV